jgi:hypothetical protein
MHCEQRCWVCARRTGVLGVDRWLGDGTPCSVRLCVPCWRASVNLDATMDREAAVVQDRSVLFLAHAVLHGLARWAAARG